MTSWSRWTTASALAAALVVVPAGAALADTSSATASPLSVTTALGVTVATAPVSASSDGTSTQSGTPPAGVLGGQGLVTAGVVAADAVARADGTSAACGGLVGSGGSVQVGSDGTCAVNPGAGGISISLTPVLTLTADAIVSSCTASSAGTSTTRTTLLGAKLSSLGTNATVSATGGTATLLGLASVTSGAASTSSATAGPVSATALRVSLLSGTAAVRIGAVTCGPNAVVVPTPALPAGGWPVALAGAAVGVLGARTVLRRAARATTPVAGA